MTTNERPIFPRTTPLIEDARQELRTWSRAVESALVDMLADVRAGKIEDDTLQNDMRFLYHILQRQPALLTRLMEAQGPHRGPGLPGYQTTEE